jgi:hypothetical protein
MTQISDYLPFLIPIIALELILALSALVHIFRHRSFKFGNMFIWIIIVLFLQIIGPIFYFTIGRGEE